jgi:hypothetical protein
MKHLSKITAGLVVLAGMTLPATAQLTLSLAPVSQSVASGGTVTYNIDISGLKSNPDLNGPALGAFSILLDYDSTVALAQSVAFGSYLSNSGPDSQTSDLSTAGQIYLSELSFDSASVLESSQPSSFVLGTLTLEGVNPGATALSFDLANTSLSDENGNSLTLSSASGATLTVVPEPGTYALTGLGLAAGWVLRRRQAVKQM